MVFLNSTPLRILFNYSSIRKIFVNILISIYLLKRCTAKTRHKSKVIDTQNVAYIKWISKKNLIMPMELTKKSLKCLDFASINYTLCSCPEWDVIKVLFKYAVTTVERIGR